MASDQGKRPDKGPERRPAELAAELIGSNLRNALQERGMSIGGLARGLGMSERHLEDIAAGRVNKRGPRERSLRRIADHLGMPLEGLVGNVGSVDFTFSLTLAEQDVLYALSAKDQLPIGAVLRKLVLKAIDDQRTAPGVPSLLRAIIRSRAAKKD